MVTSILCELYHKPGGVLVLHLYTWYWERQCQKCQSPQGPAIKVNFYHYNQDPSDCSLANFVTRPLAESV
jgi:hypothetical protein